MGETQFGAQEVVFVLVKYEAGLQQQIKVRSYPIEDVHLNDTKIRVQFLEE